MEQQESLFSPPENIIIELEMTRTIIYSIILCLQVGYIKLSQTDENLFFISKYNILIPPFYYKKGLNWAPHPDSFSKAHMVQFKLG